MTTKTAAPEKLVGALVNGLSVLRYLQRTNAAVGVTQVARDLSLNPSTCYHLLRTLVHEGLVVFDDKTKSYTIGLGLVALAQGALDRNTHIRMLHPALQRIARKHGVTMTLWNRMGEDRAVLVDRADSGAAIHVSMNIGQRLPLFLGALGRCFAAYSQLPAGDLRRRYEAIRLQDPQTFEDWLEDVEEVHRRGYAIDRGNYVRGVTTISAPVLNKQGEPVLAMSAVAFSAQVGARETRELAEDIRVAAQEASLALGGSTPADSAMEKSFSPGE
ncbi:MAG: IclR family transcriptional regulator [Alphaproteobacteria bacterium]|nr:IclR family transcriptional regulator [Alphaproteobacteria bacterium]MDX5369743.1 IclR family transcriptional regulator [Alphaproteobacteria bacterium]MDX5464367.1 IclR family transcriptional regulator [Alphaproteobacteria bacterium]